MNRKIAFLAVLPLACLSLIPAISNGAPPKAPPMQTESPTSVATKLMIEYAAAMKKKDYAYFDKNSTPDFTYVEKGKTMKKAQALTGLKEGFNTMQIKSLGVKLVSAKKAEGGVVYVFDMKMVADLNTGQKKPSVLTSTMRTESLAVKSGGQWMTKRMKDVKDVTKIDGKVMKGM